jgi:hypothetical protein
VTNGLGFGFGAAAGVYDEVRPGYPAVPGERLLDVHGGFEELGSIGAPIDGLGGSVVLELRTTLVLARA